ncbi:nuclear transport factor 2 family protein [Acinetobacter populi]|uniref:DUF4440 domain-containing protein n=1 Tax=Acinetobacter populi TaxID=1582270 RepID=A0A1Z9YVS6_9GAMM|nr:nuclear transport factor 2 family protein [Acinetobacter populi]OUY06239.1 DUF4440 domain-containing protein [Acinetobacter populi]
MEAQVRKMEKNRFNSLINKQYDHFAAICDQNLRYVHTSGAVDDLSSFMNKLQAGYYDYQQIDYDIVNVIEMQDCIIVVANFHANLLVDQKPRTLQNRALSIWKKEQEQLKLMIYQATPF